MKNNKQQKSPPKPSMNILFVASEAVPFAKEGGLGDVAGTLPKYIKKEGHDIRLVMPRYYRVDREKYGLKQLPLSLAVWMGPIGLQHCGVYEGRLPGSDVIVYFIEHDQYYGRDSGLYSHNGKGYLDNDNRFVFLSRAALELCKAINFKPDIAHVNDWHTAVIPVFLNTAYRHDPILADTASILTIHNIEHQGDFYRGLMDVLSIGWEHFHYKSLEKNGRVNLLKGGIYHSTLISTVSEGYAYEIQTPQYGYGLHGVVRDRAWDLFGILNGVDYDEWNPETDTLIAANYSEADLSGKIECKRDLQRTFLLHEHPNVPIIGLISRLVKQKGIDVFASIVHRLMALDVQIVILGTGEPWANHYFGDMPKWYPGRFGSYIGYNNTLAHKIEAGADFFLMPSNFEPCGMNQMFSLRYGTLPIVRAVGGLNDTVINFDKDTQTGTGFKYYDQHPDALYNTIRWALSVYYHDKDSLYGLITRAMKQRFTWQASASKYIEIYHLAIKRRIGEQRYNERFQIKNS